MINWHTTSKDSSLIAHIIERAEHDGYLGIRYSKIDRLALQMDITACHLNGCALDLAALLKAPRFDFFHDLRGIQRHIDRRRGTLRNEFLPRHALPVTNQ